MCLLTYFPPGSTVDIGALYNGALFNDDGHGYAIVDRERGRIIVRRAMKADDLITRFAAERAEYPHAPALFHSRFTTHGVTDKSNCHPFALNRDPRTVVAHNGILPAHVQPVVGDVRSDTRVAAEDFLPQALGVRKPGWLKAHPEWMPKGTWRPTFGSLDSRSARRRFRRWLGSYNKIVILTVDPRWQRNAYVINEAEGVWDGGVWYSNYGYLPPVYSGRSTVAATGWGDDDWYGEEYGRPLALTSTAAGSTEDSFTDDDRKALEAWLYQRARAASERKGRDCEACFSKGTVEVGTGVCEFCRSCEDCLDHMDDCLCYSPERMSSPLNDSDES